MISELSGNTLTLAEYMSELSEETYTAGWMDGLEYALWKAVIDGPRKYGRLDIDEKTIKTLDELSASSGGWIYFDDETQETFIGIGSWTTQYQENIECYTDNGRS
jgi:hypothetical protein